jgi:1-acyl-sn-glycerol-3-phosphate acyltransferase
MINFFLRRLKRAFYVFSKTTMYVIYKIGWRLEVRGRENIPSSGAVIFASNHRSYADPPLVGASVPREVHFLAKQELFYFRPFGWMIGALNAHPLNRGSDIGAIRAACQLLEEDFALIIFPEGGRSKTDDFRKFKAGVGLLAKSTGSKIVPTYIHNSGYMKKFKKLFVTFGPPISPEGFESYEAVAEAVKSEIQRMKDGSAT